MPPAAGSAWDRSVVMLLTGRDSIREVVLFRDARLRVPGRFLVGL